MNPRWSDIYRPLNLFQNDMSSIMDIITIDEWTKTLDDLNTGSAAGPSFIDYRIIRKLPESMHNVLINFVNISLSYGLVPSAWKTSHIFPIPKPQSFGYDMKNTRPIALLDTLRKVATKLLTNRLSTLLKSTKILKGLNFCGLKEESTSDPLQIMNNLMEDARDYNKELWIATQDMRKAYDSVSIESLKLALLRIDLPLPFVNWIIDLFTDRKMAVITHFGLSKYFTGKDGIDQGDAISPL